MAALARFNRDVLQEHLMRDTIEVPPYLTYETRTGLASDAAARMAITWQRHTVEGFADFDGSCMDRWMTRLVVILALTAVFYLISCSLTRVRSRSSR
ncbi:hypothetical protein NADFUDRAFT_82082 [Nadsonia fulvescens var. elongata DSM 6958]|uniref:Uncharacterized protein n=1 Tax=Nadsonia fulvescens var. elongata DSM 6958 TaxID=857566 RepID=A0A1E3PQT5_9ASCO|nr:hypothetical protein NADFUDRAFT_82082 [Nadsonia fulvescens var. elongata DSM 6958]